MRHAVSVLKQVACVALAVVLLLTLAGLWLPTSGRGQPDGQGGYITRLAFGFLEFMELRWVYSPMEQSINFSVPALLPLLVTIGLTCLLVWLYRITGRRCERAATAPVPGAANSPPPAA